MEVAILRLIHISAGITWAGMGITMGWFIIPALAEAGPAGGAVMKGVAARRLPQAASGAGVVTVLAGLRLYQLRFTVAWLTTLEGLALTLALLTGISALVIGVGVQRPTAMKLGELAAANAGGPPTEEMKKLSARMLRLGNAIAWHLATLVLLMAGLRLIQALS